GRWPARRASQGGPPEVVLLLGGRPARRVEKRQLGAEETDAFGPLLETLDRFRHRCCVGQHRHAMTVRGHGRLVATAARFLASNLSSQSFLTSSLDTRPVRAADDDTVIPV